MKKIKSTSETNNLVQTTGLGDEIPRRLQLGGGLGVEASLSPRESGKKRKSTTKTKNMVQTAVWLPRDMHAQLKQAGGDRGLGDEIRRRLQLGGGLEIEVGRPRDQKTDDLLTDIKDIARELSRDEPWHADPFKVDVLRTAIDTLLAGQRPNSPKPQARAKLQAEFGEDKAETIGRLIARAAIMARERFGKATLEPRTG
jgi:hypothetical protein